MSTLRPLVLATTCAALLVACGDAATTSGTYPDGAGAPTTGVVDAGGGGGDGGATTAGCAPAEGSTERVTEFTDGPPLCLVEGRTYVAILETNQGTLRIDLRPDIAPVAVNSFVNLARYRYFDGTTCHRAIQDFVVQCGDPTATGRGGPGYSFIDELSGFDGYRIGSVAMANSGPDTNGSQWFIITGDSGAALPQKYTLFGQVQDADLGLLAALSAISNPADGPPLEPIDIVSITIDER